MTEAVLEATGIHKRIGHRVILEDVNIRLECGRFVAVMGPNGAGKSTLIKILALVSRPSQGSVVVSAGGQRVEKPWDVPAVRSHFGIVFHESMLYGDLTAWENLQFYARLFDVADIRARVDAVLGEVGLTAFAFEEVRTFSRGMLQRLTLARALLHAPDILLMDEPFTGLDVASRERMTELLMRRKETGATGVIVTHYPDLVRELCDETVHLDKGRRVA